MHIRRLSPALGVLLSASLAACAGGTSSLPSTGTPPLRDMSTASSAASGQITLSPSTLTFAKYGHARVDVAESGYAGAFAVDYSACFRIADAPHSISGSPAIMTVYVGSTKGSCAIKVSDKNGNTASLEVYTGGAHPAATAAPAATATPAATPKPAATTAAFAQITHIGHDQCIGSGNQTSAVMPLYQTPVVGHMLLVMDFFNGTVTRTMPDQPMKAAVQGNDFAVYTHVVQPADQLAPLGPYQSIGRIQYSASGIHGTCISEWSGVDPNTPIASAATSAAAATALKQSIAVNAAVPGGVAYAMFATADNQRIPALEAGWTQGDYSNVCSNTVCGPTPHASDISEYRFGAQAADITWKSAGRSPAYAAIVILNPAP